MDRLCRYVEFSKITLNIFPLFAHLIFEKRSRESETNKISIEHTEMLNRTGKVIIVEIISN